MAVSVRGWIRCLQQALRTAGYAVRLNGLWDEPTRRALWYRSFDQQDLLSIGAGTLWLNNAVVPLRDPIQRCLGGTADDYSAGFQSFVNLVADVEATGKLETEGGGGVPWAWVAAGAAVVLVGVVSVALWRQGRRRNLGSGIMGPWR